MAITLETLSTGDTNYISKHNNNYATIKSAIDALQLSLSGSASAVTNFPSFAQAMLGVAVGKMSESDVVATDGGSAELDISSGTVWIPSAGQARASGSTTLDFTGQSTDTYYTHVDTIGAWSFDTTATDAVHSIAFTSPSTFTTITELAVVVWGNTIFQAAKTNTALGGTVYQELDDVLEALGGSSNDLLAKTITTTDVTLTTAEGMENATINMTGTLTGDRNLIVPDFKSVYIVVNGTGGAFTLTVKTAAGTGVAVTQGAMAVVVCDGTNVLAHSIESAAGGATPFVVGAWKNGLPGTNERVLGFSFPGAMGTFTLPADATGSSIESETAATAQTDLDLQKNGASIGTVRFAAAGTVATFVGVSATDFVQGDLLEIQAPGTADASLAELYFTLYCTRA